MAREQITREVDQLKADLAALQTDMASLIKVVKDAGIDQGREYYELASDRVRETGESVRVRATGVYDTAEKQVEEHPLTSVLTAFGTGFVVGMLLDRRHDHRHHREAA
jgi:ElaB/YqjD/DUF883 family membrane-anchored ribosome-binding protein